MLIYIHQATWHHTPLKTIIFTTIFYWTVLKWPVLQPHKSKGLLTNDWESLLKSHVPTNGIFDKHFSFLDACYITRIAHLYKYWPLVSFLPTVSKWGINLGTN
jgi:hypothetical protein